MKNQTHNTLSRVGEYKKTNEWVWVLSLAIISACSSPTSTETNQQTSHGTATVVNYSIEVDTAIPVVTAFDVSYLTGKFAPATHPDFVNIEIKYASESGMFLRRDTYEAFKRMADAATKAGISLKIISATRPFAHQKRIWENKWNGKTLVNGQDLSKSTPDPTKRALVILEYSSMPGTSRHHWGTDFDLNNLTNAHFETGSGKKMYEWLTAHAAEFGFCQPYSPKNTARPTGYNEEKWHWSYMPVSTRLTELARTSLKNENINGFEGANTAVDINIVAKYVLGINKDCL